MRWEVLESSFQIILKIDLVRNDTSHSLLVSMAELKMQHTIPFAIRSLALRGPKSYYKSLGFDSSMRGIVIYYNLRALLKP